MNAPLPPVNRRVLIVDDNASIHRDFRHILEGSSDTDTQLAAAEAALFGGEGRPTRTRFEVTSAYQGQEALALLMEAREHDRPFAMAFVDMRMPPGWDGVETIEQLWRHDPALQVAICSAYSDYSWEAIAKRLDLRDRLLILKKPFDNVEVYQLANALTTKWQMTREAFSRLTELERAVEERTRELRASNEALRAEIVQRGRLEDQLALRRKLESIGQLAAGIAHEINTPIQYVGDSLHFVRSASAALTDLQAHYDQLLDCEPQSAAAQEARNAARAARATFDVELLNRELLPACDRALGGVAVVADIVRAMRDFARPADTERQFVDVNEALTSTLLVARSEYKAFARVETDFGEVPEICCSPGELNQVFLHLIVNAAHAIEAAGREAKDGCIAIRTRSDEREVSIVIADNGTGVAPDIIDNIYDPFFTTKPFGKGTGQGLAVVHSVVVNKHGGTIGIETDENVGTRFIVRLPIRSPQTRSHGPLRAVG